MVPECFGNLSEYRGVTEPPRGSNGPTWAIGERGGSPQGVAAPPPMGSLNWTRGGGAAPLSFSLSLSFPLSPSVRREKRGGGGGVNPTRSGVLVGLPPPLARPWWQASSSLLYIHGQGAPQRHNIVLAVCGAPLHRLLLR